MDTSPQAAPQAGSGARIAIGAGVIGLVAGLVIGILPVSAEGDDCGAAFEGLDRFRDTYACIDAVTAQRNVAIVVLVVAGLVLAVGLFTRQVAMSPASAPVQASPAAPVEGEPAPAAAVPAPADETAGGSDKAWIIALVVLVAVVVVIGAST